MVLSIVTICFNNPYELKRTLESVTLKWVSSYMEHIIVDGSTNLDNQNVVTSYIAHPINYKREPDLGIYDAMNKGILRCSGEYIWLLNSGDTINENMDMSVLLKMLTSNKQDFVHGLANVKLKGKIVQIGKRRSISLQDYYFSQQSPVVHQACIFHTSLYSKYGLHLSHSKLAGDHEWITRVLAKGITSIYFPQVVVDFDINGVGTTNKIEGYIEALKISTGNFPLIIRICKLVLAPFIILKKMILLRVT